MGILKKTIKGLIRRLYQHSWRTARLREWEALAPGIDPDKRTYYPGLPRKSKKAVMQELKERCTSEAYYDYGAAATVENYFLYGLDREGVDTSSFVGDREYGRARNGCQGPVAYVLTFKHVAAAYLRSCGVRASCPIGTIRQGEVYSMDRATHSPLASWLQANPGEYFVKPEADMCGRNCFSLTAKMEDGKPCIFINDAPATPGELERRSEGCMVEPRLLQHRELRKFSPRAVFPVRIRTIRKAGGEPEFLSAYIGLAWKESTVSNLTLGNGIGVALDAEGYGISDGLQECGGDDRPGMRHTHHPETGDRFMGYRFPMIPEAIQLAIKAHSMFPGIHSVGWDIAILDDGPIVIEGNSDYGLITYQSVTGIGERELFEKRFKPYVLPRQLYRPW